MVEKNNGFGLKLFPLLLKNIENENLIFSPYSLITVLSMLLEGTGGISNNELRESIEYNGLEINRIRSGINNINNVLQNSSCLLSSSLYVNKNMTILRLFKEILKTFYDANSKSLEFEEPGRTYINDWVKNKTKGMIENLIKPNMLDENTICVLINTIFFNNTWKLPFNKPATKSHQFALLGDSEYFGKYAVKMMEQIGKHSYGIHEIKEEDKSIKFTTCSIDFKNNEEQQEEEPSKYKMVFVVPEKNTFQSMENTVNIISKNPLQFIDSLNENEKIENVHLKIPKFTITSDITFNSILQSIGINSIFTSQTANLTKVTDDKDAYVSYIIQKSKIEIDEDGCQAAAASSIIISGRGPPKIDHKNLKRFHLYKPFLYFIMYDDLILFTGSVLIPDPSDSDLQVFIFPNFYLQLFFDIAIPLVLILGVSICVITLISILYFIFCKSDKVVEKQELKYRKMKE